MIKNFVKYGIILVLMFRLNDSVAAMSTTTETHNSETKVNYDAHPIQTMKTALSGMKESLEKLKNKDVVKDKHLIEEAQRSMMQNKEELGRAIQVVANDSNLMSKPEIKKAMQDSYNVMVQEIEKEMQNLHKFVDNLDKTMKK